MTLLLAPVVSEKGTFIADKHEQVIFRVAPDATKPEVKAAVELMFKVAGRRACRSQRQGQGEALRPLHRPPAQLEEGLRVPEAGPGNQLRGGGAKTMALVKVKPTSPGRRALVKVVNPDLHKGAPVASLVESAEARLGPQQQRPHHDAAQGRRPQAPLPHRRLPAQQGRHPGEGRAPRIRPEPQRQHRAAAVRGRRAPLHHRAARRRGRHAAHVGHRGRRSSRATACRCATSRSARRCTASRCSRARARRSRARPARRVQLLAREGIYAQLRLALGRDPQGARRLPRRRSAKSATKSTTCARSARRARNRWRGIRPTVRGIAMNPVDHPMGGRTNGGGGRHHPMSPWGTPAKGYKTRKNKRTDSDDRAPPSRDEGITRTWHVQSRKARSSTAT